MTLNPYWGGNFWSTLSLFCSRLFTGEVFSSPLASDEVQLIVLTLVGLSSCWLGTFLIYRRMTMLANSLSHTILLGIVFSYLFFRFFNIPGDPSTINIKSLLIASLLTALFTTFSSQFLEKVMRLQTDASIGLVFTTYFALGILLVTLLTKNAHVGVEAIMGNIDALHPDEIGVPLWVTGAIGLILFFFHKPLAIDTFDPRFSKSMGISGAACHTGLMICTAAVSVCAFRSVGVFLFLTLLVGPPLIARMWTSRLPLLLGFASGVVLLTAACAVALSRHFLSVYGMPLSTSALFTTLIGIFYLGALVEKRLRSHPLFGTIERVK